MFFSAC